MREPYFLGRSFLKPSVAKSMFCMKNMGPARLLSCSATEAPPAVVRARREGGGSRPGDGRVWRGNGSDTKEGGSHHAHVDGAWLEGVGEGAEPLAVMGPLWAQNSDTIRWRMRYGEPMSANSAEGWCEPGWRSATVHIVEGCDRASARAFRASQRSSGRDSPNCSSTHFLTSLYSCVASHDRMKSPHMISKHCCVRKINRDDR